MDFWKKIWVKSILPDLAAMLIIYFSSVAVLHLSMENTVKLFLFILALYVSAQFVFSLSLDFLVYKKISLEIKRFYDGELDEQERTMFLEKIMGIPRLNMIKTTGFFTFGTGYYYFIFRVVMEQPIHLAVFAVAFCLVGSFFAGIMSFQMASTMCSKIANDVITKGVDAVYVAKKRNFGMTIGTLMFMYAVVPCVGVGIMLCGVLLLGYLPLSEPELWASFSVQLIRMIATIVIMMTVTLISVLLFLERYSKGNARTTAVVEAMRNKNLTSEMLLETDLQDEISYGYYLINRMIKMFQNIMARSAKISEGVSSESKNLMSVSHESETTAIEQSAGVSEIVSTMDTANRMAREIEMHVSEVADLASLTAETVSGGVNILQRNLDKILEIAEINENTRNEIQNLNSKISNVWEVVNFINTIADQTKIIAFNAELESTSVSGGGKNFRNVANEIRRLANNTMDSTEEIKRRIIEMQNTMADLSTLSMNNTAQIDKGYNSIHLLEESFSHINNSSEANATVSAEIKQYVMKQAVSFEQMSTTISQISSSLQGLSDLTHSIINAGETLQENADALENITSVKGEGDE